VLSTLWRCRIVIYETRKHCSENERRTSECFICANVTRVHYCRVTLFSECSKTRILLKIAVRALVLQNHPKSIRTSARKSISYTTMRSRNIECFLALLSGLIVLECCFRRHDRKILHVHHLRRTRDHVPRLYAVAVLQRQPSAGGEEETHRKRYREHCVRRCG
jgi:hypothetical protein